MSSTRALLWTAQCIGKGNNDEALCLLLVTARDRKLLNVLKFTVSFLKSYLSQK